MCNTALSAEFREGSNGVCFWSSSPISKESQMKNKGGPVRFGIDFLNGSWTKHSFKCNFQFALKQHSKEKRNPYWLFYKVSNFRSIPLFQVSLQQVLSEPWAGNEALWCAGPGSSARKRQQWDRSKHSHLPPHPGHSFWPRNHLCPPPTRTGCSAPNADVPAESKAWTISEQESGSSVLQTNPLGMHIFSFTIGNNTSNTHSPAEVCWQQGRGPTLSCHQRTALHWEQVLQEGFTITADLIQDKHCFRDTSVSIDSYEKEHT